MTLIQADTCGSRRGAAPKQAWTMASDHGPFDCMEEIQVSKFKATCLAVLDRVGKTRKPVLVTRFGKSVAQIVDRTTAAKSGGRLAGRDEGPRRDQW